MQPPPVSLVLVRESSPQPWSPLPVVLLFRARRRRRSLAHGFLSNPERFDQPHPPRGVPPPSPPSPPHTHSLRVRLPHARAPPRRFSRGGAGSPMGPMAAPGCGATLVSASCRIRKIVVARTS